jgi:uncharacterized protein YggE
MYIMKRKMVKLMIVVCIILAIAACTVSASEVTDEMKGTLSTSGTASDSYPPDTAEVVLAIENTERTVSQATQANNRTSGSVIKALKTVIDKARGDEIKTSSYSVNPKYEYDNTEKKNRLVGYTVTNQITVKTDNTQVVGKLIDTAIEQGSNRIQSIRFTISDDREYCKELLERAAQRAEFEAEVVAQSLGTTITGIKSVSSSCSGMQQPPVYARGFAQEAGLARSSAPVEPGSIELMGSVSLVFFIDNSL